MNRFEPSYELGASDTAGQQFGSYLASTQASTLERAVVKSREESDTESQRQVWRGQQPDGRRVITVGGVPGANLTKLDGDLA